MKKTRAGSGGANVSSNRKNQSRPLAVVGIGASAGGLDAFRELLSALPTDTGMAFVIIQHLDPSHASPLTELLASATSMPTREVRSNTRVAANHVYVISPDTDLTIEKEMLQVSRRKAGRGKHLPIDSFFASMAKDQGARAIGVILSGTASDGTSGLRAIRVEGGITFAQEPDTAQFDGMPSSAIMADCVDFVLPPKRIAARLADIARHPYVEPLRQQAGHQILFGRDDEWLRLFKMLKAASGIDFSHYKKTTVNRRIARRMALHKVDQLGAYLKLLGSNREELDALQQDILIHVTSFFREPAAFRAFQKTILPRILRTKQPGESVRMWIAGCSTGEEVYSLAICLFEVLGKQRFPVPVQIFGTDISEQSVTTARAGIYPASALTQVSPEHIRRFFKRLDGKYQVNSNIRDVCVFARHDLTRDPPFSRLDVIACRNVLIYLEPVLQKRVLATFHYALRDTGYLILGKSETLGNYPDLFSAIDRKNKFFVRKAGGGTAHEFNPSPHDKPPGNRKHRTEELPHFDLEREADRYVWDHYAHAGLIIDNDLQILQFRGDTSRYLRPLPGKATFHLLRMLRDELVLEVRGAVNKVRRTGLSVRRESIRVKLSGKNCEITVEVHPLSGPAQQQKFFLILFEETLPPEESKTVTSRPDRGGSRDALKLNTELARTREYLQSIIQEQESTNEELKTANEEALSSMEELQSSNEELETAKEELQSSNEELVTLNEQLQTGNVELARSTDDLTNLLKSVNIPIVMLGADRHVRRFTPAAEKLLNLIPGDVGRPLRAKRIGFDELRLEDMLASVLARGIEKRQEVLGENDRWYSVRLFPYRTSEQKVDGVLIAFVDVHELRQSQEAVKSEIALTSAILDTAKDLLVVVLDRDGRIVRFNRNCQRLTGYPEDEVLGRHTWQFLVPIETVAEAKTAFRKALAGTPTRLEYPWLTKRGERLLISWSNTVTKIDDVVEYVVGAGIDVTERHDAAERAREKEATVQALLQSAAQAILATNKSGRVVLANAAAERAFGYSSRQLIGLPLKKLLKDPDPKRPEGWGQRKSGETFPAEIGASRVDTRDGPLSVWFVSDITERRGSELTLRSMTARLLSMQENSRKIIARELHDDITQKLAALSMEASTLLKRTSGTPQSLAERIRDLGRKIGAVTEDVHRMSRQLHPKILDDLGLEAALNEECILARKQMGIPVAFRGGNIPRSIPENVALCFLRVAQESLHNIAKHARAKQVHVSLIRRRTNILLSIEDDGAGFDIKKAQRKGRLGLVSIEERVRLVGGTCTISTKPGKGTHIEVQAPLQESVK